MIELSHPGNRLGPGASGRWLRWAVVLLTVIGSTLIATNSTFIERLGKWGYAGAFAISLLSSATVVLPVPGMAVIFATSAALNPILLGILAGIGSALGELTGYAAGASGRALAEHRERYEALRRFTLKYGAVALFLIALFPLPVFDLAGIAAGALKIPVRVFLISVACGKITKYLMIALAGAYLL
ncbi:MAG: VTT domain-containing protein [Chloroflexi bacterium]|nr:VTT domain-containing protein [Chloroflexota bacterium]